MKSTIIMSTINNNKKNGGGGEINAEQAFFTPVSTERNKLFESAIVSQNSNNGVNDESDDENLFSPIVINSVKDNGRIDFINSTSKQDIKEFEFNSKCPCISCNETVHSGIDFINHLKSCHESYRPFDSTLRKYGCCRCNPCGNIIVPIIHNCRKHVSNCV